ncbi:MAG TPA: sulfotransferase [Myxococcota bacterium]|nr:sulfotransferase [Myxococcota bacterium]
MLDAIRNWLRRPSGPAVIVVSGLPRSGTSMMMRMLEAGGVAPFTDGERTADIDNPEGYYEYRRVMELEKDPDRSWVRQARGRALKVISFLLRHLPHDNVYRIVYMRRNLDEVLTSQDKMLDRLGNAAPGADLEAMKEAYRNDIVSARLYARKQPNMEMLEVHYAETVADPVATARTVNAFLGGGLDEAKMAAAVKAQLYRNRA